jgi:hypothetical protein
LNLLNPFNCYSKSQCRRGQTDKLLGHFSHKDGRKAVGGNNGRRRWQRRIPPDQLPEAACPIRAKVLIGAGQRWTAVCKFL